MRCELRPGQGNLFPQVQAVALADSHPLRDKNPDFREWEKSWLLFCKFLLIPLKQPPICPNERFTVKAAGGCSKNLPPDEFCRRRGCFRASEGSPLSQRLKRSCFLFFLRKVAPCRTRTVALPVAMSEDFSVFHVRRQICFRPRSDSCCAWFSFRLRRPVRETRRIIVSEEADSNQWRGDYLGAIVRATNAEI
jgi:hypothetical protein